MKKKVLSHREALQIYNQYAAGEKITTLIASHRHGWKVLVESFKAHGLAYPLAGVFRAKASADDFTLALYHRYVAGESARVLAKGVGITEAALTRRFKLRGYLFPVKRERDKKVRRKVRRKLSPSIPAPVTPKRTLLFEFDTLPNLGRYRYNERRVWVREQVELLRCLRADGWTAAELAEKLRVTVGMLTYELQTARTR